MKKFLTVLLVIAVMFTFSFGSAFATTADANAKAAVLAQAKAIAEKVVADNYDAAMKKVVSTTGAFYGNLGYTEADANEVAVAWSKIDVKAEMATLIEKAYVAEAKDFANYDADAATYAAKVFTARTAIYNGVYAGALSYKDASGSAVVAADALAEVIVATCGLEAVYNMYEADRAELLSAFDKINWAAYSNDVDYSDADERTYLEIAEDIVEAAKEEIAAEDFYTWKLSAYSATSPTDLVTAAIPGVERYVASKLVKELITGTQLETGLYLVKDVDTKDAVAADKAVTAAEKAALKAIVAQKVAEYAKTAGVNADSTLMAAYTEAFNTMIDASVVKSDASIQDVSVYAATSLKDNYNLVQKLVAEADKYKAEKNADGVLVRDAETVDKIVKAAKKVAYASAAAWTGYDKAVSDIIAATIDADAAGLAFAKDVAKENLADALDALEVADNYYAKEAAVIQANYDKALAKIEAATTVAKVKAVTWDLTKDAKTAATVDGTITWTSGAPYTALEAVEAYVAFVNTGKTVLNADYINYDEATVKEVIAEIYGEAGARTQAERKAVAVDAAAVAAELSTTASLAAAKNAAEDAIKALPAKITVADHDAVVAAWELAEDYADLNGHGTLTNAAKLEKAVEDLYDAHSVEFAKKIALVDTADKAAVRALIAEIKPINKLVAEDEIFENENKISTTTLTNALNTIRAKELAAVEKAINAIPVNVTEADKAAVEAARAAFDAFVADWTDYTDYDDYYAAGAVSNFRTLALAEAALGLNAEDPAYSVEALKITASSKATKGAITVKWSVKGDTSAVEGYEIWKSTKKNSGYKKAFTATKMSYKNTKDLKKGTRYFYKVRAIAYTAEGEKVKSDWSNKAYRVAK